MKKIAKKKKIEKISIVIPCFNEQEALPLVINKIKNLSTALDDIELEVLMIDNNSTDDTLLTMRKIVKNDKRFHYISFSKNFGKDASMYAGLKYSTGDYVTILDADGQDPPELILEMYKTIKSENVDSVAAYRKNRVGEPFLRSILADFFYSFMNKISNTNLVNGARDFRLMTRRMVDAVLELEESERFTKGIFAWVGFKTKWIPYDNVERIAGKTQQPMIVAFKYAIRGIISFSTVPLFVTSIFGFVFCSVSILYAIFVLFKQLIFHEAVPGYPSIICIMMFGFGMIFFVLGIIGQYLAQMYLEIKNRPKYIIKESNVDKL